MKFSLFLLMVIAIFSSTSVGTTYSMGSAVNLAPIDALTSIDNQITTLPPSAFKNIHRAAYQKKALCHKIDEFIHRVEYGEYNNVIHNLNYDIKNNIWKFLNESEQTKLLEYIDNAIASVSNASKTTINTVYGKVAGVDAGFGSWAWKGIPYAKPPIGALRWKAPRDPKPWGNIRFSTDYTPSTQPAITKVWTPLNQLIGSEDCLYLDVYRPKTHETNLPVYFWIHCGGNFIMKASDFPGSTLAGKSKMVVVVVEYRLGPLGFFTHPALNPGGSAVDRSGNYGTLDQLKALEWVRKNIAFFGGDPNNVTVAGDSAGGFDTLNLMISPLARDLFHKAIVQSAVDFNIPVSTGVAQANGIIEKLLVADGTCVNLANAGKYRASMSNGKIEVYLRGKSAEDILKVMQGGPMIMDFVFPVIDGTVIPGTVTSIFESGNYNHVPVILGSNQDEMKPFLPFACGAMQTSNGYTWSNVFNTIGVFSPSMTLDELMPPDSSDRDLYETCAKYPSMYWKAAMVDSLARLLKKHQNNVYCYYFKWGGIGSGPSPFDLLIGAGHSYDIAFFFGWNKDFCDAGSFTEDNKEGRIALQQAMMSYAASFAATGNPNKACSSLPVWEEWSNKADEPKSIVFDADLTRTKIRMMNQEFTKEEVMAQINTLTSPAKDVVTLLLSLFGD